MPLEGAALGADAVGVPVGGIPPPKASRALEKAGVKAIFGPGTNVPEAAKKVLSLIGGGASEATADAAVGA